MLRNIIQKYIISSEECIICFKKILCINHKKLYCGHIFHRSCINKWFNHKHYNICPICSQIH